MNLIFVFLFFYFLPFSYSSYVFYHPSDGNVLAQTSSIQLSWTIQKLLHISLGKTQKILQTLFPELATSPFTSTSSMPSSLTPLTCPSQKPIKTLAQIGSNHLCSRYTGTFLVLPSSHSNLYLIYTTSIRYFICVIKNFEHEIKLAFLEVYA